jgi:hypothetical protein
MTDTIELLEAIGCDASLRYAAADELRDVLERAKASPELAMAMSLGDGEVLRQGLGRNEIVQWMPMTQSAAFVSGVWSE